MAGVQLRGEQHRRHQSTGDIMDKLKRGEPIVVFPIANGFAVQRPPAHVLKHNPEVLEFGDRDRMLAFLQKHFIWPPDGVTDGSKREI